MIRHSRAMTAGARTDDWTGDGDWCSAHDLDHVLKVLARAGAVGKIYDIADVVATSNIGARGMIQQGQLPDGRE